MARPKKDPTIKQKEFILAAKDLFFSKGYEETAIQDILKAVGNGKALSPSVFYYYFSSKEGLLEAVIQDYMATYLKGIMEIIEASEYNYAEKMQQIMNAAYMATEEFTYIDSYFDQGTSNAELFNFYIDKCIRCELQEPLTNLILDASKRGEIPLTPLLQAAGAEMLVQIMLWSIYPLSHQGRESDGKHHNEKYLSLMPLIFSQLLDVPFELLNIKNN
ncbi:TetR/AcrR family transcriptional regulator [Anaerosporobacter faecicola]|uniref:TetR/AcrR family transcriptional regulator n=1 Tax=Anaerosporobacter faecicola TaxID=2718714 RepID=UPI00143B94CB|nr:TetR/AcrR family transcriptional regulator [Anaerosporobacter faecicola]